MAADNPAFTPDQENHSGVFTISNNAEERPNHKQKVIEENQKNAKFWMGWYRQIQQQCGLKNDLTSSLGTILLLTIPSLLLPSLLASPHPPIGIYMPPLAWIAGRLFERVGLPPTPAMLIVGLVFRSLGWFELTTIWKRTAALTRYVAVAVVLLKGGLALAHLPNVPLMVIPCTFEATSIAALSYFLLGFEWKWGYVFGFAMSAASSSVSAQKLTQLKAGSYGTKELYGLILPTSTVENIYSITAFTVTLTLALIDEGSWTEYVLRGVAPVMLGPLYALSWGFLCSLFPNRKDEYTISKRSVLALLGGCLVYLGAKEYNLAPGGPLGTMLTGASLSFFWRAQGWTENNNPVLGVVTVVWNILEPALFSLVGAEVDVFQTTLHDILLACIIMAVSMMVRLIFFYLVVVIRKQLTCGEIIVGLLVWFPKATVLAALSPQVLDNVRKARHSPPEEISEEFAIARMVLLASVIEMIVTAPIAYAALNWFGDKLLPRKKTLDKEASIQLTINETQFNNAPVTRV